MCVLYQFKSVFPWLYNALCLKSSQRTRSLVIPTKECKGSNKKKNEYYRKEIYLFLFILSFQSTFCENNVYMNDERLHFVKESWPKKRKRKET